MCIKSAVHKQSSVQNSTTVKVHSSSDRLHSNDN
uniref:Uncharacterized protein n=1 Tax=Rhizophora mucronata TaxID=61149 RepID=A0A2P2PMU9_RHIMU